MGYQSKPSPEFFGTSLRAMEEEVSNKVDAYVHLLHQSAEECEEHGVLFISSYFCIHTIYIYIFTSDSNSVHMLLLWFCVFLMFR